jgi:hypothetical protein
MEVLVERVADRVGEYHIQPAPSIENAYQTDTSDRVPREPAQASTTFSAGGSVADLERKLSTERVIDLFTMQPKVRYFLFLCLLCFMSHIQLLTAMSLANPPS